MKKLFVLAATVVTAAATLLTTACGAAGDVIYVNTNAYFAPFEYYDSNLDIVGADVDIMNLVGKKLGKKVKFENTDFDVIIDNVAAGNKYDCGAAGITITEERKQKVDFSKPYFTSVQYAIFPASANVDTHLDGETEYVLWDALEGKKIGVQRDTTGDIYVNDEIDGGELKGAQSSCTSYDNAQLAVDAIGANQIDTVVVDKLPAEYIVGKNPTAYKCYALYYPESADESATADFPVQEEYAIAVHKGDTELLNAINAVLDELGDEGVSILVSYHFMIG